MIHQVFAVRVGWLAFVASAVLLGATHGLSEEPQTELLWPAGAPGAKGEAEDDQPTLTAHLPAARKATGTAVVVCPGGGYGHLAIGYEGHDVARWLADHGVVGFVLKYRHRGNGYGHPAPLDDAQRALRTVRARAAEFGVDPERIGILGFSAGGHLASSAGVHFDAGDPDAADAIERASSRPDFLILCYPVISFTAPVTHQGSRQNLLGKDPDPKLVRKFSTELQVTAGTPPTFLWHTTADKAVPAENSVLFYLALRAAGVPAELHVYEHGRHGLGLAKDAPGAQRWTASCFDWLRGRGLLPKP